MANIEANRALIRRHGDVLQTVTAGTFIEATTAAKTPSGIMALHNATTSDNTNVDKFGNNKTRTVKCPHSATFVPFFYSKPSVFSISNWAGWSTLLIDVISCCILAIDYLMISYQNKKLIYFRP